MTIQENIRHLERVLDQTTRERDRQPRNSSYRNDLSFDIRLLRSEIADLEKKLQDNES